MIVNIRNTELQRDIADEFRRQERSIINYQALLQGKCIQELVTYSTKREDTLNKAKPNLEKLLSKPDETTDKLKDYLNIINSIAGLFSYGVDYIEVKYVNTIRDILIQLKGNSLVFDTFTIDKYIAEVETMLEENDYSKLGAILEPMRSRLTQYIKSVTNDGEIFDRSQLNREDKIVLEHIYNNYNKRIKELDCKLKVIVKMRRQLELAEKLQTVVNVYNSVVDINEFLDKELLPLDRVEALRDELNEKGLNVLNYSKINIDDIEFRELEEVLSDSSKFIIIQKYHHALAGYLSEQSKARKLDYTYRSDALLALSPKVSYVDRESKVTIKNIQKEINEFRDLTNEIPINNLYEIVGYKDITLDDYGNSGKFYIKAENVDALSSGTGFEDDNTLTEYSKDADTKYIMKSELPEFEIIINKFLTQVVDLIKYYKYTKGIEALSKTTNSNNDQDPYTTIVKSKKWEDINYYKQMSLLESRTLDGLLKEIEDIVGTDDQQNDSYRYTYLLAKLQKFLGTRTDLRVSRMIDSSGVHKREFDPIMSISYKKGDSLYEDIKFKRPSVEYLNEYVIDANDREFDKPIIYLTNNSDMIYFKLGNKNDTFIDDGTISQSYFKVIPEKDRDKSGEAWARYYKYEIGTTRDCGNTLIKTANFTNFPELYNTEFDVVRPVDNYNTFITYTDEELAELVADDGGMDLTPAKMIETESQVISVLPDDALYWDETTEFDNFNKANVQIQSGDRIYTVNISRGQSGAPEIKYVNSNGGVQRSIPEGSMLIKVGCKLAKYELQTLELSGIPTYRPSTSGNLAIEIIKNKQNELKETKKAISTPLTDNWVFSFYRKEIIDEYIKRVPAVLRFLGNVELEDYKEDTKLTNEARTYHQTMLEERVDRLSKEAASVEYQAKLAPEDISEIISYLNLYIKLTGKKEINNLIIDSEEKELNYNDVTYQDFLGYSFAKASPKSKYAPNPKGLYSADKPFGFTMTEKQLSSEKASQELNLMCWITKLIEGFTQLVLDIPEQVQVVKEKEEEISEMRYEPSDVDLSLLDESSIGGNKNWLEGCLDDLPAIDNKEKWIENYNKYILRIVSYVQREVGELDNVNPTLIAYAYVNTLKTIAIESKNENLKPYSVYNQLFWNYVLGYDPSTDKLPEWLEVFLRSPYAENSIVQADVICRGLNLTPCILQATADVTGLGMKQTGTPPKFPNVTRDTEDNVLTQLCLEVFTMPRKILSINNLLEILRTISEEDFIKLVTYKITTTEGLELLEYYRHELLLPGSLPLDYKVLEDYLLYFNEVEDTEFNISLYEQKGKEHSTALYRDVYLVTKMLEDKSIRNAFRKVSKDDGRDLLRRTDKCLRKSTVIDFETLYRNIIGKAESAPEYKDVIEEISQSINYTVLFNALTLVEESLLYTDILSKLNETKETFQDKISLSNCRDDVDLVDILKSVRRIESINTLIKIMKACTGYIPTAKYLDLETSILKEKAEIEKYLFLTHDDSEAREKRSKIEYQVYMQRGDMEKLSKLNNVSPETFSSLEFKPGQQLVYPYSPLALTVRFGLERTDKISSLADDCAIQYTGDKYSLIEVPAPIAVYLAAQLQLTTAGNENYEQTMTAIQEVCEKHCITMGALDDAIECYKPGDTITDMCSLYVAYCEIATLEDTKRFLDYLKTEYVTILEQAQEKVLQNYQAKEREEYREFFLNAPDSIKLYFYEQSHDLPKAVNEKSLRFLYGRHSSLD